LQWGKEHEQIGATFRCDDHKSITIGELGDRINALSPTLCPSCMQTEQRPARKWTTNLPCVSPKFLNDRHIPFVLVTHFNFL